ncbi:MAG: TerC family protein [Candidatus Pseudobacter hemicellulosilyticus]|uniref:TerC family protein n=1 Tax=Candidatus Pseudobacter hemicellulosilyticus TaxID=3121375 RepID=A0AAJ5WVY1_9BACT|nr:MAG: TerC family protein [Pseudobacter sp.]
MEQLLSVDALISLLTLTTLEVVLGIDNVIFVSILMGRLNKQEQLKARRIWMIAGIAARVALLLAIGWLVNNGNRELFGFDFRGEHHAFNLRNVIMFVGGLFLLYKTVKEIHHKLEGDEETINPKAAKSSFGAIIGQIILIDMVFSFDSIITAVGLAKIVSVMIIAVIIAMIVMFFFADKISGFIHQHPTLKMLALAFLLMVGFSLFFEGLEPIHHSHIDKGYIYVSMAFSFGVEMLNMWMRKKAKKQKPVELREPVLKEGEALPGK